MRHRHPDGGIRLRSREPLPHSDGPYFFFTMVPHAEHLNWLVVYGCNVYLLHNGHLRPLAISTDPLLPETPPGLLTIARPNAQPQSMLPSCLVRLRIFPQCLLRLLRQGLTCVRNR